MKTSAVQIVFTVHSDQEQVLKSSLNFAVLVCFTDNPMLRLTVKGYGGIARLGCTFLMVKELSGTKTTLSKYGIVKHLL